MRELKTVEDNDVGGTRATVPSADKHFEKGETL